MDNILRNTIREEVEAALSSRQAETPSPSTQSAGDESTQTVGNESKISTSIKKESNDWDHCSRKYDLIKTFLRKRNLKSCTLSMKDTMMSLQTHSKIKRR